MTVQGRRAICLSLRQENSEINDFSVIAGGNDYFRPSATTWKAVTLGITEYGSGTSMLLSSDTAGSEASTTITGGINLNATTANTSITSEGKLALTYVFTNTTGAAITIRSVALATKTGSNTDWCILSFWENVPERVVENGEVFTFTVVISPT